MKTKNEDIIKKLFESKCSLSPEERAALNNYEYVNDTFHRQWEEMSEEAVDLVREEKILNGIMKKVRGRRFPFIKKSFYKYGMAAMIAVCMVLSALLLMKNSGEEIIYVVNTGYQSMDSVRLADGTKVISRWNEDNPNPNAACPRLYGGNYYDEYNKHFSDYQLFDADYFRIKTISLGYMVPKDAVTRWGLSSLKFFLTGENLFTFRADKDMKDFDPESSTGRGISAFGAKSVAFGVNVSF